MQKIRKDEISMRARWLFVAERLGLQGGLALTIIVLIFLLNAFLYYIKSNGLLMSLHFGDSIWQNLLHSLPYDLILIIIAFAIVLNIVIKKFDFSYKRPFILIMIAFIGTIMFFSTLIFYSNFNHSLRRNLEQSMMDIPFLTDFYVNRCCMRSMCQNFK